MPYQENLDTLIANLDRGEKNILKEHSLSLRYQGLQRLGIACMKLYAFYRPTPKQKRQIERRSARYADHKLKINEKLSAKLRKEYNDPCVFVRFDDIGPIVEDREAIIANSILLARHMQRHPELYETSLEDN